MNYNYNYNYCIAATILAYAQQLQGTIIIIEAIIMCFMTSHGYM